MRGLQTIVSGLIVLGGAASLLADPIDPGVVFNTGGKHSTIITCKISGCITTLDDPITNGGGTFDIHNESGKNIVELIFFIPTVNFDQAFSASSNLFTGADIFFDEDSQLTVVQFSGTGNGSDASALVPPPEDSCDDNCAAGFENGAFVSVESIFGTPKKGTHPGLVNGGEGILGLEPTIPEPGTFVLLFSAAGVLLGARKFRSRQAKSRV